MSIITKVGNIAKEGFNKINSSTYTSGKVVKNFANFQKDAFQSSIKGLNKDAKTTTKIKTVLQDGIKSTKTFFKKYMPKIVDKANTDFASQGPTKIQKGITKAMKSLGVFVAGVLSTLGFNKAQKTDEAPDYVSCSCCE